jgi:hypothetical protein
MCSNFWDSMHNTTLQGAEALQGPIRPPPSSTSLECKARRNNDILGLHKVVVGAWHVSTRRIVKSAALVITRASLVDVDAFKAMIKDKFKMSDMGLLSNYLDIEVQQLDGEICLSQSAYAIKALEYAGPNKCNP